MDKAKLVLLLMPIILFSCKTKQAIDYVDPFVGTDSNGHTYPGATMPFGAVQLSPDTRRGNWDACSGYHYNDSTITGFSHTHISGTGCVDLGDILFHPTTGNIKLREDGYISDPIGFSHANEKAQPGYYSVKLHNGILAELTATTHVGVHRYTFPKNGEPKIVIDLAHLLLDEPIKEAELRAGSGEISGMRCTRGWVDNQYVYFVARFSRPYTTEFVADGKIVPESESLKAEKLQAVLTFPGAQGQSIECKVGVSIVSYENAKLNLEAEAGSLDFDQVRQNSFETWENALSAYQVSGGTSAEMTNFYTAVYHAMLTPNVVSDVNGEYRGADMKTRNAGGRKIYSTFSIWDTFRAWNPLMTLTDTSFVNEMINSFLDFYDQTGELPIWPLSAGETGTMIGFHSVSIIYDAYAKNIRGFDAEKALEAMKVSAAKNRRGVGQFLDLGYIPANRKHESVSSLLECSYDYWCIAQMAKDLGHEGDYKLYTKQSEMYKNVFDGSTLFFRGRNEDGTWESPFDPYEVGRAYTEANAWQYRFFVPQDMNSMVNLFGGQMALVEALDSLFNTSLPLVGKQLDISGLIGQYAHGNEPSHHIAYLYSFLGQPWKTQHLVRRLLDEMYKPQPHGISGNEDCGQMSAWYILSSLGLYEVCPGTSQFVFTSPLFEKAEIRLANGKKLEITANNPSKNVYIKSVSFNGNVIDKNYITYSELKEGGQLQFVLDSEPDTLRGVAPVTYPYSESSGKEVSVPYISNDISYFLTDVSVNCGVATPGAEIRFTLDGTDPTENSQLYKGPFMVTKSTTIKLKGFKEGYAPSAVETYYATKVELNPSVPVALKKNEVHYSYYEGDGIMQTSEIKKNGRFVRSGACSVPNLNIQHIPDHFGVIYTGYIDAPVDGVYLFSTESDDGSVLEIDGKLVVDNDGSHGIVRATGRLGLKKGFHSFKLLYFDNYEDESLSVSWTLPGSSKEVLIEPKCFFIK